MASIWQLATDGPIDVVNRKGKLVATITENADGTLSWDGFGMYRTGFKCGEYEKILEDVKWFHRYQRGKPKVTLTFESGRKLSYF